MLLARCILAARNDPRLKTKEAKDAVVQTYAEQALKYLQPLVTKGQITAQDLGESESFRPLREAVPSELLERTRRTIRVHGLGAVARATKIDRGRLLTLRAGPIQRRRIRAATRPAFSRVEIAAPPAAGRPLAEIEMPTGVKVRIFAETAKTLELLSSLCGSRGG